MMNSEDWRERAEKAEAERDAARALVKRLAEALVSVQAGNGCTDCRLEHYFDRGAVGGRNYVKGQHHPRCLVSPALEAVKAAGP